MFDPDVVAEIIEKTLQKSILGDLFTADNKSMLYDNSLIRPAGVGEVLCHQGQIDKTLYLIVKGEVEVDAQVESESKLTVKLGAGELIGEISALFSIPRIANVTVTQPTIVLEISADVFWHILRENPFAKDEITKRCRKRIIETSLRCVPLFADLDEQSMGELASLSSLLQIDKNTTVAHEGYVERSMFVICSGTAKVSIELEGKQHTVALLDAGDYFGEYALFSGDARSASVTAITNLQLVEIKGESFQSFVDYYAEIGQAVSINWQQRYEELKSLRASLNERQVAETRLAALEQMLDA